MTFLTTGEVAAVLHITIPTVKRWVKCGHLGAFKTGGGHYRVTRDELERFCAARHIPIPAEGPLRVLIVDDDPKLRDVLCDVFAPSGPFKVEVAEDGYEGLIKLGGFHPHLLILDLHMPGLDGFQVCRRVKKDPATCATKILAVTGYADGSARERIIDAGADGFLEKPLALATLEAEVERLTGVPIQRVSAA